MKHTTVETEVVEKICPQCGMPVELIPGSDIAELHHRRSYSEGKIIRCEHSGQRIEGPAVRSRILLRMFQIR